MDAKKIRGFVVGPERATPALRQVLEELNVDVLSDEVADLDAPLAESLRKRMAGADFVLGIVPFETSSNAFFELGIAVGARKPLFLLVDRIDDLPGALRSYSAVTGTHIAAEALRFHLQLFLDNLSYERYSRKKPARSSRSKEPVSFLVEPSKVQQLHNRVEMRVAEAFSKLGCHVVVEPRLEVRNLRPDMAVWLEGVAADIGDQILVEVKGTATEGQEERGTQQLLHFLRAAHLQSGILVLHGTERRVVQRHGDKAILILDEGALEKMNSVAEIVDLFRQHARARDASK